MRSFVLMLLASALLSSGCAQVNVIPDPAVPHQVAEESQVTVWARRSDGTRAKVKVRLLEGWWVASPMVVEAPPSGAPGAAK